MLIFTIRTAQGGGGSFNDRRPIGEFGCCESRKVVGVDRKAVGVVSFGVVAMLAVVTSPTTAGCILV